MKRFIPILFLNIMLAIMLVTAFAESEMVLPESLLIIGEEAFLNTNATSVTLPEGVRRIESHAFSGSDLRRINLPDGLTYIAPNAFEGCDDLVAEVAEGSYAQRWCIRNGVSYTDHARSRAEVYSVRIFVHRGTIYSVTVKASTNTKSIAMFDETGNLVGEWAYAPDEEGWIYDSDEDEWIYNEGLRPNNDRTLIWDILEDANLSEYNSSFYEIRASRDGVSYDEPGYIFTMPNQNVLLDAEIDDLVSWDWNDNKHLFLNVPYTIGIKTSRQAQAIELLDENGQIVKRWTGSEIQSNLSFVLNSGNPGFHIWSIRGSSDGIHFDEALNLPVYLHDKPAVDSVYIEINFYSSRYRGSMIGETNAITVKASPDSRYIGMFDENGRLIQRWDLSGTEFSKQLSLEYTFLETDFGAHRYTFKASRDGVAFSDDTSGEIPFYVCRDAFIRSYSIRQNGKTFYSSSIPNLVLGKEAEISFYINNSDATIRSMAMCDADGNILCEWNDDTLHRNSSSYSLKTAFTGETGKHSYFFKLSVDGSGYDVAVPFDVVFSNHGESYDNISKVEYNIDESMIEITTSPVISAVKVFNGHNDFLIGESVEPVSLSAESAVWRVPYIMDYHSGSIIINVCVSEDGLAFSEPEEYDIEIDWECDEEWTPGRPEAHFIRTVTGDYFFIGMTSENVKVVRLLDSEGNILKTWDRSQASITALPNDVYSDGSWWVERDDEDEDDEDEDDEEEGDEDESYNVLPYVEYWEIKTRLSGSGYKRYMLQYSEDGMEFQLITDFDRYLSDDPMDIENYRLISDMEEISGALMVEEKGLTPKDDRGAYYISSYDDNTYITYVTLDQESDYSYFGFRVGMTREETMEQVHRLDPLGEWWYIGLDDEFTDEPQDYLVLYNLFGGNSIDIEFENDKVTSVSLTMRV